MNHIFNQPKFRRIADSGLLVEYGAKIDPEVNQRVQALKFALESEQTAGITEIVPAYCSVLIVYDVLTTQCEKIEKFVCDLNDRLTQIMVPPPETIEVPVCYGDEFGPDLQFVAEHNRLTEDEVVELHSTPRYPVYMLGFTPGFPFLGGLAEKLYTPRLDSPRTSVPAGSVGIANDQTGIYPIESPGGWQLIGRTPVKLFDPDRKSPFLLKAGDFLKFKPISADQLNQIAKENNHDQSA